MEVLNDGFMRGPRTGRLNIQRKITRRDLAQILEYCDLF
jgi:hypothetical protein